MAGRTPEERQALGVQGQLLVDLFERAGFSHIAPEILQPADLFLDRSGENIRARTFVFTDPSGAELCLRPDLTVPACRYHLSHAPSAGTEARYCYLGPAFRFQHGGAPAGAPPEFEQAGVEWYADQDHAEADAETLKLALAAVEAAGLADYGVRLGDLGLFKALLRSIPMPERWRRRLMHQYWRPQAFRALLDTLTGRTPRPRSSISALIDGIAAHGPETAGQRVERELDSRGLALVGGRSIEEIAGRLAEKAADRSEAPLPEDAARLFDRYLSIAGPPQEALKELQALAQGLGEPFGDAVSLFERRMLRAAALGTDLNRIAFSGAFGRNLEYYTGYMFQIEVARENVAPLIIGGGGRYDELLSDIGSPEPVPAVGFALYTERLLAATRGLAP
ncbi:MAG: ATP phosphoribosyltransferase regulatory subunit [Parvibaculaceae bacterium]